jgi:hypothetical protein
MKSTQRTMLVATMLATLAVSSAHAQLIISEVSPYSSGNAPFAADWFELTNTSAATITLSGWKVDDNSNLFSASVPMTGITTIAAGESVVYIECAAGCAAVDGFRSYWGGAVAGVQIGTYSGAGIGLSTGGDAVNIYHDLGTLLTRVDFGASVVGRTFDNGAGLNNTLLTTLSTFGVNGAFNSLVNPSGTTNPDVGSPSRIAAVPEPESYAMFVGGLWAIGAAVRTRRV